MNTRLIEQARATQGYRPQEADEVQVQDLRTYRRSSLGRLIAGLDRTPARFRTPAASRSGSCRNCRHGLRRAVLKAQDAVPATIAQRRESSVANDSLLPIRNGFTPNTERTAGRVTMYAEALRVYAVPRRCTGAPGSIRLPDSWTVLPDFPDRRGLDVRDRLDAWANRHIAVGLQLKHRDGVADLRAFVRAV